MQLDSHRDEAVIERVKELLSSAHALHCLRMSLLRDRRCPVCVTGREWISVATLSTAWRVPMAIAAQFLGVSLAAARATSSALIHCSRGCACAVCVCVCGARS